MRKMETIGNFTKDGIKMEHSVKHIQAALKIQRAWRVYWNTCPYCYRYGCLGVYSEFKCRELWDEADLVKLDAYLDRLHDTW